MREARIRKLYRSFVIRHYFELRHSDFVIGPVLSLPVTTGLRFSLVDQNVSPQLWY
jgi:hypothetical protein